MNYLYLTLIAILGFIWGSFITVIIWRIDDIKSIFTDRSRCVDCRKEIAWYDLIPLISYGILRGRCRHCKRKISSMYPLIEIFTAIVFILIFIYFGISWSALILLFIFSILIITLGYDAVHMMVVDQVVWVGIALVILWQILNFSDWTNWISLFWYVVLGGLVGIAIPGLLVIFSKGKWMGEGDVTLGLMVGLLVGYPNIFAAYIIALLFGAVYGLITLAIGKKKMKDPIPFGPFLVVGATTAFFIGDKIVNWYINISYWG